MDLSNIISRDLCVCGKTHEIFTRVVNIEKNITPEIIKFIKDNYGIKSRGCIICDENTYNAAKDMIYSLGELGLCESVKLDIKSYHADEFMLEDCEEALENQNKTYDYFIACGAGTIHDITRVVAHRYDRAFISYPTAASCDGFVSGIAPVTTKDGMKISLPAVSPIALFADIKVLANAPKRLTAAGVGDILGKYIALADWRISNLLTGEYICRPTVELEYKTIDKIKDLLKNFGENKNYASYERFCKDLLEALVITGLCMQYTGNSRPASGAEHHVAHFFEMGIILSTDYLHGENVGFGSILCSNLYHKFAESKNIRFTENYNTDINLIKKYFGKIYDEIIRENESGSVRKVSKENFYNNLDNIKNIIFDIPSKDELIKLLGIFDERMNIGEIEAYDIKCAESEIAYLAFKLAPYIRDRLTLLKLMRCIEF